MGKEDGAAFKSRLGDGCPPVAQQVIDTSSEPSARSLINGLWLQIENIRKKYYYIFVPELSTGEKRFGLSYRESMCQMPALFRSRSYVS